MTPDQDLLVEVLSEHLHAEAHKNAHDSRYSDGLSDAAYIIALEADRLLKAWGN